VFLRFLLFRNWRITMSTNQSNEAKFFDLHTTGIGYLNRIREVKPRGKGKPFMAVTVAALRGSMDDAEYSYIDCNVVGAEAEKLIVAAKQPLKPERRVLVSFRIGDIWTTHLPTRKAIKKVNLEQASRDACCLSAGSRWMAKPSMKQSLVK